MLNLLQSSFCGSDTMNIINRILVNPKNQNVQHNNNRNFDENIKMESDRISVIVLKSSPTRKIIPVLTQTSNRRSSLQKFFLQNYSEFFKNYCLCLNRKIEPDDQIEVVDQGSKTFESNNNYATRNTIIPITVALKMYVVHLRFNCHYK